MNIIRSRSQAFRLWRQVCLAVLAPVLLAGWSNAIAGAHETAAEPAEITPAATEASSGTNDFRIGYRTDAAPFSYQDAAGQPSGYTVEICRRIVAAMRAGDEAISVEFLPLTLAERGPALLEGRVDLLCGADTVTLSRREAASFSLPVFAGGIGALLRARASKKLRSILEGEEPKVKPRWRTSFADVLNKRTFAVVADSLAEQWLRDEIDEFRLTAEIVTVTSYADGIEKVADREADVLFGDRAILLEAAAGSADLDVLKRRFTDETIAIVMARGNEDLRLLVDRTLSELYRSGEIIDIYSASFGKPDPETLKFIRMMALPE